MAAHVSIPFIAGQWSLLLTAPLAERRGGKFQSPSLRGSGRFANHRSPWRGRKRVSIPFIAGQWSLRTAGGQGRKKMESVSIPFIAGQWSLRSEVAEARVDAVKFQSPSLRGSGRFQRSAGPRSSAPRCFNPLHCGAVVASRAASVRRCAAAQVSIPFIAGQWSLRHVPSGGAYAAYLFQSPSLRGSGRFTS